MLVILNQYIIKVKYQINIDLNIYFLKLFKNYYIKKETGKR